MEQYIVTFHQRPTGLLAWLIDRAQRSGYARTEHRSELGVIIRENVARAFETQRVELVQSGLVAPPVVMAPVAPVVISALPAPALTVCPICGGKAGHSAAACRQRRYRERHKGV